MKILYGVCGEGFGHAFRVMAIGNHLEKKGHEVLILSYGKAYEVLKEKFKVKEIEGLNYVIQDSEIKKSKTVVHNFKNFSKNLIKHKEFRRIMKKFRPDVCITDFEPISAYLAKIYRLPLISIDNEHAVINLKLKVPKGYKTNRLLAKNIVRAMTGRANFFIVVSFFNFLPKKKNVFVVPPILRPDILDKKIENGNNIVVYLSRENDLILNILRQINKKFIVFGYNIDKKEGNIEFRTKESFLTELAKCKAIIATAGFSSISEAIYLKKPYFALPIKGQFEQMLNAMFIKRARFGEYSEKPKKEEIEHFLNYLKNYQKALKEYNPDYNKLFKVLDKLLKEV